MYRIDVFEKAAELCGYSFKYVKYNNNGYILFAEGFVSGFPHKVRWNKMGHCYNLNSCCRLPKYDLPLHSVVAMDSLEFVKKLDDKISLYTKQVIEKAAELCGYEVYIYDIASKSMKVEGFVPGVPERVFWNTYGFCYRYKDKKRLYRYDLPIDSAREQLKLEEYNNVCR